jgi:ketosteroid isomerase-like protein
VAIALLCAACATAPMQSNEELQRQVAQTERAFAKTMADRDHARFATFIAEEAVFFAGEKALRGRPAIAKAWAPFYENPTPPFSWEPDQAQVLDKGSPTCDCEPPEKR